LPAPFVSEAGTAAARAADEARDWERDRKAWNLPRAQIRTIAPIAGDDKDEAGAEDDDPEKQDASPPASPPEPIE
jgi:hypothetical protein